MNQYHYHKYLVYVKSPFAEEVTEHSRMNGWAFDGYAIHGPLESHGVMAQESKPNPNPLNEFNGHLDADRGWHYHVTPGKFSYILGGYRGTVAPRNFRGRGMIAVGSGGPGGGRQGPPGGPGFDGLGGGPPPLPLMTALDTDHDGQLSPEEIKAAPGMLKTLDQNGDGKLTEDEP